MSRRRPSESEKQCFKCGEVLPLNMFYRHPQMKDGRLNKCKECNKKDVRENRRSKIDYYRAFDIARGDRHTGDAATERSRRYRKMYPTKYKVQTMTRNAVRDGRLEKSYVCEECGKDCLTQGHHDDYAKPLEVRWLCSVCHCKWHAENGPGLNGE
jgi:hypothetical protein